MKNIYVVIIALVVGLVGFGGGYWYGSSKVSNTANNGGRNFGQFTADRSGAAGSGMNGQTNRNSGLRTNRGNGVRGSIISLDNNSLTLKLDNGGSTIVFYASSTPINKMATGSITDLKVGEQIMAMGQANTDGSINASSLQLMSASSTFRFGVGGNGPASGDRNLP